jgi:hypothetical protein
MVWQGKINNTITTGILIEIAWSGCSWWVEIWDAESEGPNWYSMWEWRFWNGKWW